MGIKLSSLVLTLALAGALMPSGCDDPDSTPLRPDPATPKPPPTILSVVPTPGLFQVGNTDGDGVWLRKTPAMADKVTAWPDGTLMIIVGADTQAEGRTWHNVKDPNGIVGWVPAEYLVVLPASAETSSEPAPFATATAGISSVRPRRDPTATPWDNWLPPLRSFQSTATPLPRWWPPWRERPATPRPWPFSR